MCTAISFNQNSHLFGRTLDLEYSYNEKVIITPRKFEFAFRNTTTSSNHYAIIGIGIAENNYPLYYDAVNENGLAIAGLNFPNNAIYNEINSNKVNLGSFEFIPYILSNCDSVDNAIETINSINLTNDAFSERLAPSPLHWLISDNKRSITVEPLKECIKIYENNVGVLTNNPTFDFQLFSLNNYRNISPYENEDGFCDNLKLNKYSRGLDAMGLPGDLSSNSRFIRTVYTKLNSVSPCIENGDITQFFHILEVVSQTNGCVRLEDGKLEKTVYTSCCDTKNLIYYFTTYCNRQINAVKLLTEDINSKELLQFNLEKPQAINYRN